MTLLTIATALQKAQQELSMTSDTALLDSHILLAHVLQVSRSYLFAFAERELTLDEIFLFEKLVAERKQKIPLAYLTGHQEFWSLDLLVTPDTLIPRPETELLVELVLQKITGTKKIIADLGTGSGAIALAIANERPTWEIHATDVSQAALEVAKLNAARLHLSQIMFHKGDWMTALPHMAFDAIVSNPPYIAMDDPHFQWSHEPLSALISADHGLSDIHFIIREAKQYLQNGGILLLEHGFQQACDVRRIFEKMRYSNIETHQDLAGLDRVTCGTVE